MMNGTSTRDPIVKAVARPTTIIEVPRLSAALGVKVTLASETFQWTGSFKFRAAYNLAASRQEDFFITASSGNFGQALAYACRLLGKRCLVVMPSTSAQVKIDSTRSEGARVDLLDVSKKSRSQRVNELQVEFPEAFIASAYDDPLVIEGNSTFGMEIAAIAQSFDCLIVPVGGGGLISGVISGLRKSGSSLQVYGSEPLLGNDAAKSLLSGFIISNETEPKTIADGARTLSIGQHNWEYIRTGVERIITVSEQHIEEAVRLLFFTANLKTEPTAALSLAALLCDPGEFRDRHCLLVVSGGNVDPAVYLKIIGGDIS